MCFECDVGGVHFKSSLPYRRILGGPKLVHVRIVVAAIFDFMTEEDWGE